MARPTLVMEPMFLISTLVPNFSVLLIEILASHLMEPSSILQSLTPAYNKSSLKASRYKVASLAV